LTKFGLIGAVTLAGYAVVRNAPAPTGGRCDAGPTAHGYGTGPFSNWIRYQPGTRFWAFQSIETGIFLALTALLIYLALRRIRRIA
jgi:hypothetical protein